MTRPKIADVKPKVLDLGPGKYAFCTCGLSADHVFCDGSHAGTDLRPQIFEIAEPKRMALCQCKMSKELPVCDGIHKLYTKDDQGK